MSEWVVSRLPQVLAFREGPGIMASDFRMIGVPLIRLAGLKNGANILDGCNYLDPEEVDRKWSHFRLREHDVLLSTSASLGEVAGVGSEGVDAIPYTGIVAFRPKTSQVDPSFVRFMLTDPSFVTQIEAMGVGSVMKHFGPTHLRNMYVRYPGVTQQRAIAEVLGSLDDKIAANDRIIRTADSLSSVLFSSMLREDTEDVPLSATAEFVNGRAFTKGASGTGRVVIRIAELNSGIGGSTVFSDIDVPHVHLARPGDLLFAWSGSLTVHRWYRANAIVNQHIFRVIPKPGYPLWSVNELLRRALPKFKAIAADKATTMGHIQRHHLDESVAVPSKHHLLAEDARMDSLWRRALAAEQENVKLSETRDTLLPLLMSGKICVKDAEDAVQGVV
ncbi:MAG: restriction endonuclease subunit S [Candidatus Nanopelagicales bacterium]